MADEALPSEEQREKLCELIYWAFLEIRLIDAQQAYDLADAFHNLPKEMYGHGKWSVPRTRAFLVHYQDKHRGKIKYNYVAAFDKIFPDLP